MGISATQTNRLSAVTSYNADTYPALTSKIILGTSQMNHVVIYEYTKSSFVFTVKLLHASFFAPKAFFYVFSFSYAFQIDI